MRNLLLKLAISAAIAAAAILWLTQQGFEILPPWHSIRGVTAWWAVPVYAGLFALFNVLRGWRWIYLLRPFSRVPTGAMMDVAFVGFVAIQMMPLRTGEVVRPYLLDRYAGISKSALFGTIAIERVVDGLLVSLWLTAALFAIPASRAPFIWGLRVLPLAVFVAALALLVAFYIRPDGVRWIVGAVIGLFSQRLAAFTLGVLERFHAGLGALPSPRHLWAFVGVSAVYWGVNAVSFQLLAIGCGLDLSLVGAVAGMGCLAVGILLPAGPGYFGNFQVSVLAAVGIFLPAAAASTQVAVFVFLLYMLQTGLTIAFGVAGGLSLRHRPVRRRVDPSAVTDDAVDAR